MVYVLVILHDTRGPSSKPVGSDVIMPAQILLYPVFTIKCIFVGRCTFCRLVVEGKARFAELRAEEVEHFVR